MPPSLWRLTGKSAPIGGIALRKCSIRTLRLVRFHSSSSRCYELALGGGGSSRTWGPRPGRPGVPRWSSAVDDSHQISEKKRTNQDSVGQGRPEKPAGHTVPHTRFSKEGRTCTIRAETPETDFTQRRGDVQDQRQRRHRECSKVETFLHLREQFQS